MAAHKLAPSTTFERRDFVSSPLEPDDYVNCRFVLCTFSCADLSGLRFEDCVFEDCDLSHARVQGTAFLRTRFVACKLTGLQFDQAKTPAFTATFESCQLQYAGFVKVKFKAGRFHRCRLTEADFAEADLPAASFDDSDLSGAIFRYTNLEGADFRSAINYTIDPTENRVRGLRVSLPSALGLLQCFGVKIE